MELQIDYNKELTEIIDDLIGYLDIQEREIKTLKERLDILEKRLTIRGILEKR